MVIIIPADRKFHARKSTGTVKKRISFALWRFSRIVFLTTLQKMDTKIWGFSRFTTVTAHFHSMLQSSSAASWRCGLCTSIAKTWRTVANCLLDVDNNAVGS